MKPVAMRSAIGARSNEVGQFPGALFQSNQIAAFGYADNHMTFATKVRDCVVRTFNGIGSSPTMQQVICWNLSVTQKVGLDEVADKPAEFMEGIHTIFGQAGSDVFEYMLIKEIKREFGLTTNPVLMERKSLAEVLQLVGSGLRNGQADHVPTSAFVAI
jgi:hypothetical protein